MTELIANLLNVNSTAIQAIIDSLYGILLIIALKRRKEKGKSVDVVTDDLEKLVAYHKTTAASLEKTLNQAKEKK